MTRRWSAALAALLFLAAGNVPFAQEPAKPPNILLIYTDDLGYGDLGVYGHHTIRTPNLDSLASQGLRLTSYYAPAPLCSPSRASLLTGRTHLRTGIETWIPPDTDVQLGSREITLARLLSERGYQTWMSGKWHLNGGLHRTDHLQPGDHGFDRWLALHAWPVPNNRNPVNFYLDGRPLGKQQGFSAGIAIDQALAWLERRDPGRPFFLYLATAEPHSPIASPDRFNRMYSHLTQGEPRPFDNPTSPDIPPPTDLEARGPGEYYANVTYLDHEVGRLLARLEELGLGDETIVIFTSDNGPVTSDWRNWWEINLYGSTGGFRGRKGDLYEGGIRVPALIRWPDRVAPGTVSDAPVSGYDLLPTLAAIVGSSLPDDRPYDGEDVSALLYGGTFQRRRPLYWEFPDFNGFRYALRKGDWKLMADETLTEVRLYNLAVDRFEVQDFAGRRPDLLESMLVELKAVRDEVARDPVKGPGR